MKYEVRLQPLAESDLEEAYQWAAGQAPDTAARWLARFHEALGTLAVNPQRCGFAPEHKKAAREIRQLLFGRRASVFRTVFLIDGQVVRILRIRRAAQRRLTQDDLGQA